MSTPPDLRASADPDPTAAKLRAFQIIFALVIGTEYWTKALAGWTELGPENGIALGLATLLTVAAVMGRARRAVFGGFAVLQAWYVWSHFPIAGNHRYLEVVFAALLAFLDDENEEQRRLLLRSLQWMVIVVLFYSGLQKMAHGYYFRGQFLAYSLWRETFRAALEPLLSAGEFDRLTSYSGALGDGPYLVSSPLFLIVSNAVWIFELVLGVLLIPRLTRTFAWIGACVFVVLTELVAREFMFGVEFVAAILLFAGRDVLRRLITPIAVLLALLVLVRLGILPEVTFH